jgi:hypothetical protein
MKAKGAPPPDPMTPAALNIDAAHLSPSTEGGRGHSDADG